MQLPTAGLDGTGKLDWQPVIERTGGTWTVQFANVFLAAWWPLGRGLRMYIYIYIYNIYIYTYIYIYIYIYINVLC